MDKWMLILIVFNFLLIRGIIPMFMHMLISGGCVRDNYRNEKISVSMGLIFILPMSITMIFLVYFLKESTMLYMLYFIGILGMGFAGLLDDLGGNRDVTGLKGHISMIFKFKLTTGGFKAVFGGIIALFISLILSENIVDIMINTLIIALFTNFINLLDLRPGRALKGFLVSGIILCMVPIFIEFKYVLVSLMSMALAYLPYDLKAKSMLGDVGSNILGIGLGIACVSSNFTVRVLFLVFLILIHAYTEKYSLTQTIEKNKVLKYIDQMGR